MGVGRGMIMISSQLVEKVNNLPDENFSKELDSTLDTYTLYRRVGMIKGVVKNFKNGLIDAESALLRIEKIANSIKEF